MECIIFAQTLTASTSTKRGEEGALLDHRTIKSI